MITFQVLERFIFVFILTFIYGLQRQRSHKPVSFGTFILVSIGACAMSVIASQMDIEHSIALLSAVVTGIGFLGAGALIRGSDRIFGFTTAASIWLFAIFGVVMGLGEYSIGMVIYGSVWIVVLFDELLEHKGLGSYRKKVVITTEKFVKKEDITGILAKYCTFGLVSIQADKRERKVSLTYIVEGMRKDIDHLLKEFYTKKWCVSVSFD